MIGLIDYGSGNIHAIADIYRRLAIATKLIKTVKDFDGVSKLVLPGVGAFDETMASIHNLGLSERLDHLVTKEKLPILGVCVGMQIMAESSQEGRLAGFGWIKGTVECLDLRKLPAKPKLPHMGWNSIEPKGNSPLFSNIDGDYGYYFLHSYEFVCMNSEDCSATSFYGHPFTAAVQRDGIVGVQFHPEKSHDNGILIFENFFKYF